MLKELSQIVYDRLGDAITESATAGLTGVKVWGEARPAEEGASYVVFSVDTNLRGAGTAPLYDAMVEVTSFAPTGAGVAQLAEAVALALNDYTAVNQGVRLAGLSSAGSRKEYDAESRLWLINARWQGLAIG